MTKITFAVFDMDEVFYDYDHPKRLALLEELTGRPAAEIHESVWGGPHEERAEAGDPSTAEAYLEQFQTLLGYPIDFDTWADVRRRIMKVRPMVLDLANRMKFQVEVALLTNNGMLLKQALRRCAPHMIDLFGERAHVSAEFGARKPDPQVFRKICERYGHAPEATIFVDDREDNIAGAASIGMKVHLYTDPKSLRRFLAGHGFQFP